MKNEPSPRIGIWSSVSLRWRRRTPWLCSAKCHVGEDSSHWAEVIFSGRHEDLHTSPILVRLRTFQDTRRILPSPLILMSPRDRWTAGSYYAVTAGTVISPARKKPKKQTDAAAHSKCSSQVGVGAGIGPFPADPNQAHIIMAQQRQRCPYICQMQNRMTENGSHRIGKFFRLSSYTAVSIEEAPGPARRCPAVVFQEQLS